MEEPCGWISLRPGHVCSKPDYMERSWVFFPCVLCTCVHHCQALGVLPERVLQPRFIQHRGQSRKDVHKDKRHWGHCSTDCEVGRDIWAGLKLAKWMPDLTFLLGQGRAPGGLGDHTSSVPCKLHPFLHRLYPAQLMQHPQHGCNSWSRNALTTQIHVARKLTLSASVFLRISTLLPTGMDSICLPF